MSQERMIQDGKYAIIFISNQLEVRQRSIQVPSYLTDRSSMRFVRKFKRETSFGNI